MAVKTRWHRYGTKLRHYYPMYNAVILTESQLRFVIGRRVSHGISIWKKLLQVSRKRVIN